MSGDARLALHSPTYVKATDGERVVDKLTFEVRSAELTFVTRAEGCVLLPLSSHQLHDVFGGFAQAQEPWSYEPRWSAETKHGHIHVGSACDRLGHITCTVEVENYGTLHWTTKLELLFELGQAEDLGRQVRALTRPDSSGSR